ncbi:MAG: 3-deoxy-D-manno-octulosonate 8-phosphate phosphatase [Sulfurovum sp. PC08-66]|jgi:3-deoxy-D-manno-octulosonate 8-phosphate phosphatase (KDO 8-P phosphatase)|nr:MAG: 3-deoxy-D-manno-octulosonate 8-phosphate phosphatase [Sulfurovum sp. PC08-66]
MNIQLIVLDVDGTMTNGQIGYTKNGDEIKYFNVKDGLAIKSWIKLGGEAAIITGRSSDIVAKRAKELDIQHCYQGVKDKLELLEKITAHLGIGLDNVASIGDDLNDYQMLKASKIAFVPKDASRYVETIADVILTQKGGEGAVREMIEYLIKQEGLEEKFLKIWE